MTNDKRTELIKKSHDKCVEANGDALAKLADADQSTSGAFIRAREIFQRVLKERGIKGSDVLAEIMAERDAERLERASKLRAIAKHEKTDFIAGQEYLNVGIGKANEKRTELIKESYEKDVEANGDALVKLADIERLARFTNGLQNKSGVDTDAICREIRGKGSEESETLMQENERLRAENNKLKADLAFEKYCATDERMYGYELIDIITQCQPFIGEEISELAKKIKEVLEASDV